MASTRMSFSYPQDMKDKLSLLAKQDCRSLSSYIQRVLQSHLNDNPTEVVKKSPKRKTMRKGKRAQSKSS